MSEQIVSLDKIALSALDAHIAGPDRSACPYVAGSALAKEWTFALDRFIAFDRMLAGEPLAWPARPASEV